MKSSNPDLQPIDQIQLGILNDSQERTFTANPVANGFGDVVITFHVSDGLHITSGSFKISILPENDIPVISGIPEFILIQGDSLEIDFEVTDVEAPADELQIFATGFHDVLPVNGMFELSGDGAQRKLRIIRQESVTGNVTLQLVVVDGSGLGFEYSFLLFFGDEVPSDSPILNIELAEAGKIRLVWEGNAKLYQTTNLSLPFEQVQEAVSPHIIELENMAFFILR
ncbi:MAG: hypothetical protein HOH33_10420 [Verrucomicrobia bacterium]|jgi:hypothetical protein|nr:hypothetical protein [Verrucomicrobiota bacterium]